MSTDQKYLYNNAKDIIESKISVQEKKIQIGKLRIEKEDELNKLKKKKKNQVSIKPSTLFVGFIIIYIITDHALEFTLFLVFTYLFFKLVPLFLRGPDVKDSQIKTLEKDIKRIDEYIKVLKNV